jgi:hypothetical protein
MLILELRGDDSAKSIWQNIEIDRPISAKVGYRSPSHDTLPESSKAQPGNRGVTTPHGIAR